MFVVVSHNFVAARHPFQKRVSRCIQSLFLPPEPFLRFLQRTCPIHCFMSKTHVWGGFTQFRCRTSPIPKQVSRCIQSTSFCHRNHFFVYHNKHAQSTSLGPKLMFGVVSHNFVATRHPLQNGYQDAYKACFCHRNHFFVFCNEHSQSTTLCPKLMFGWFRAISLPQASHSENGYRVHKNMSFFPPEPFLRFSQRTRSIN
jgi:hypothetical protein